MRNTNYFGRICRFLGRIGLFIGFILCIGVGALLITSFFTTQNNTSSTPPPTTEVAPNAGASRSFVTALSQNQILSWFITGIIIAATIVAIIYLCKKYNAAMRRIIANAAKRYHLPIHMVELGSTLIIWSALLLMLYFSFTYATAILIFPFIFNELFFLFGWISYGMPDYKV